MHLLAEVIENATIFSAKDTPVHVAAQELTSGGVLIEVSDSGVGVPEARLAEMNWRLDNPFRSWTCRCHGTWACSPWPGWPNGTGCGSGCARAPRTG